MTRVYLTSTGSGSWTVAETGDYDIELIGGGGDGVTPTGNRGGEGGGGGQYAKLSGVSLTAGDTISYHVGIRGGSVGTPSSPGTADTWFSSASTVYAQGGGTGGLSNGGGNYTATGSWTRAAGGYGGSTAANSGSAGGGGGGAGGPNGAGAHGGAQPIADAFSYTGGGGGGAANGGSAGQDSPAGHSGGNGGNNRLGSGGGAGSAASGLAGLAGSAGGGGGGSFGQNADPPSVNGGAGSLDPAWDATHGPGSGGAGAGMGRTGAGTGGLAGGYGGGGGGGGAAFPGPQGTGAHGTSGIIVISPASSGGGGVILPGGITAGQAPRVAVLLRIATGPVIRVWSGSVRDLAIPAGGAETTDGAIYQAMGLLTGLPQLESALNGDAQRVEFSLSGAAVTGEVAALAADSAADIRGVAVDVGLVLFDSDWQVEPPVYWLWSGTADSLTVDRGGDALNPTRTLRLSAGNVFTGRRRANLTFFSDIDQHRRSADDNFFSETAKLQEGTTKVWGVG